MKALHLLAVGAFLLASGGIAGADTKVELKETHLCCGQCVRAVKDILKKVDGVGVRATRRPGR